MRDISVPGNQEYVCRAELSLKRIKRRKFQKEVCSILEHNTQFSLCLTTFVEKVSKAII